MSRHAFFFTGYSDDVVIAGPGKGANTDEYYSTYYRMSNGALVKAVYSPADDLDHPGWKITCDHPSATRIPAPGEDENHNDSRIPDWLDAPGYCDVLILWSDEELSIVEEGDSIPPDATPERVLALKLMKALNDESHEENLEIDAVLKALKKAGVALSAA